MTYSEKLKDPRWQRKRLEILDRDNWTCLLCQGKEKTLHVHHRFYLKGKDPWDYANDTFQTLCLSCHKDQEEALALLRDAASLLWPSKIRDLAISAFETASVKSVGFGYKAGDDAPSPMARLEMLIAAAPEQEPRNEAEASQRIRELGDLLSCEFIQGDGETFLLNELSKLQQLRMEMTLQREAEERGVCQ